MHRHLPTEMLLAGRRTSAAGHQHDPLLGPSSDICPFCVGCQQPIARPLTGACIGGRQRSPAYATAAAAGRAQRAVSAGAQLGGGRSSGERFTPELLAHDYEYNERDRPAFWFQAPATSIRSRSHCKTHPSHTPAAAAAGAGAAADRQQLLRGSHSRRSESSRSPSASAAAPAASALAASSDTLVKVNAYLQSEEQYASAVRRDTGAEEPLAADEDAAAAASAARTPRNGLVGGNARATASAPVRRNSILKAASASEAHAVFRSTTAAPESAESAERAAAPVEERARAHVRLQSPVPSGEREAAAAAQLATEGVENALSAGGGDEGQRRPASCGSSVSESASASAGAGAGAGGGRRGEEPRRRFVIPQQSLVGLERARLANCLAQKDSFFRRAFSGSSFVRPYFHIHSSSDQSPSAEDDSAPSSEPQPVNVHVPEPEPRPDTRVREAAAHAASRWK